MFIKDRNAQVALGIYKRKLVSINVEMLHIKLIVILTIFPLQSIKLISQIISTYIKSNFVQSGTYYSHPLLVECLLICS